jgi:CDGSH iron-sulfur domain-containing protein 3
MSDKAVIAGTKPIGVNVEAGKDYWWCACGKSKNQPFCDGSYKGSSFTPLQWTATESRRVAFCTCKQTTARPLCSGAHKALGAG